MKFTKMHALGNDYVYVNCFKEKVNNPSEAAVWVSDRHFGIGSDGLILIQPSQTADFEMEMYNSDGSRAEMCGNGIRCVGKYVYDTGLTDKTEISVESMGKIKYLTLFLKEGQVDMVEVDMGKPELLPEEIPVLSQKESLIMEPIEVDGILYHMTCVSMGNPHAVIFLRELEGLDLENIGPQFENHKLFPKRTNVEFVKIIDRNTIEMRVWERGSGETLACGTGACASVTAAVLNGLTENKVEVRLRGGRLSVRWDRENGKIYMTGPASKVFDGETENDL